MDPDWGYIQEHFDWLGHIIEALVLAVVVALIGKPLYRWRDAAVIGLAFAIGHFHGREKRDYEVSVHMPPPHLDAYRMWEWDWDQMTDFWPTAIVLMIVMFALSRRAR